MFTFRDFFHLPELDPYLRQIADTRHGLVLLAGLPAPISDTQGNEAPSQPSAGSIFFPILIEELLQRHPSARAVLITRQASLARLPRHLKPRIEVGKISSPESYPEAITEALQNKPDYLIVDQACEHSFPSILSASWQGIGVLAQYASPLWGAQILQQIESEGFSLSGNEIPIWILTVQRLAQLCPNCKAPADVDQDLLSTLTARFPSLAQQLRQNDPVQLFSAVGCTRCQGKGRVGSIHLFDVYHHKVTQNGESDFPGPLSIVDYAFQLVRKGFLPLEDLVSLETSQLQQASRLLSQNQQILEDLGQTLERKITELEATNRVLVKRTEELVALQDIGQALTTSQDLEDLATRVCRKARDLSGADRVILYFGKSEPDPTHIKEAVILALAGLDPGLLYRTVPATDILIPANDSKPRPYLNMPPGIEQLTPARRPGREAHSGLALPLIAHDHQVGLMIVQSVMEKRFAPREISLLEMLANQAALALQREGLIQELLDKIHQLETAQAEIIKKERLERELELARQVQQSVIPKTFPEIPGFHFAAHNEPARQVGGDFYDVIRLDEDHFGITIADVTDKGMPAALYMALTRSLILAEARRSLSPRRVLDNVNRLLLESGELSGFVTVFYGVIDIRQKRLTYTRAGHDLPLLIRRGAILPLGGQGTFLGVLDGDEFQLSEEELSLQTGDRLILYTDGMTDVLNSHGESFGNERFYQLLASTTLLSSEEMSAQVFAALQSFQGQAEQFDDMTMLIVDL